MIDKNFHFNFDRTGEGNNVRYMKVPLLMVSRSKKNNGKIYTSGTLNTYGFKSLGYPENYVRGFDFKNKCIVVRPASKKEVENGQAFMSTKGRHTTHIPMTGFVEELTKTGFFQKNIMKEY